MGMPENYREIAGSLRERAAKGGLSQQQAEKIVGLADYFEKLAVDPARDIIPDKLARAMRATGQ